MNYLSGSSIIETAHHHPAESPDNQSQTNHPITKPLTYSLKIKFLEISFYLATISIRGLGLFVISVPSSGKFSMMSLSTKA